MPWTRRGSSVRLTFCPIYFARNDMSLSSEIQPRRNEEREGFFFSFFACFVFFVSWWLIFIVSGRRSLPNERPLLSSVSFGRLGAHLVRRVFHGVDEVLITGAAA